MNRCESGLLTKVIADLGSNGIAKFAAATGVSVSTVTLCLRGEAPRKLATRIAIANGTPHSESDLFPSVESLAGASAEEEAG